MDPRLLTVLFVVFAALCIEVVRRGYRDWKKEGAILAELESGALPELLRRHRRKGQRLVSLTAALIAMVALAFLAPLGAPRLIIVFLQIVAVAALALGMYWTVRT